MYLRYLLLVSCLLMIQSARSFLSLRKLVRPNIFGKEANSVRQMASTREFSCNDLVKFDIVANEQLTFEGDLLLVPFSKPVEANKTFVQDEDQIILKLKENIPNFPLEIKELVSEILSDKAFKGEVSKKLVRVINTKSSLKNIGLLGIGKPLIEGDDLDVSTALKIGSNVAQLIKGSKAQHVGFVLPQNINEASISTILLGLYDTLYEDNRFKKTPKDGFPKLGLKTLHLLGCPPSLGKNIQLNKELTETIASGFTLAKDLVGAPSNIKTPLTIAQLATDLAKENNMEIKILGQKECEELGMGGYLSVQQGSQFPPQFIHMTYKPTNSSPDVIKIALVGKGLTFDSGGYNLKNSMIELMKFDMGGCAAVLGCAKTIGQLRPKNIEVHFITAVCENMISAEAMRPGDIVTASNGKTIEILNTDAEGRLTLADALIYAEKLNVDAIVDLATLTGACIMGLGEQYAGVYSDNSALLKDLLEASKRTDDKLWHLPLEKGYKDSIKSKLADLKNLSSAKGGGSITAALFLQEFIEKTPWAHIDMAGPVWKYSSNSATGFGVKLLVDYLLHVDKKNYLKK